jgi:hypothetical protein
MVDLALLQSVSYIAGALGVCVAATYYVMNLKVQQTNIKETLEARQMQLYMQSLQETRTKNFLKDWIEICYQQTYSDYQEWRTKYGPSINPESYAAWVHVTQLYQGIGYLVESKMLDPKTLAKYISPRSFIFLWEKMQPIVKYHREHLDPTAYESFEYLVNEMNSLLKSRFEQQKTL